MRNSYMRIEDAEMRFPRLVRSMRFAACLNSTEAASAIVMHRAGHAWAGEAVNHYGGVRAVLRGAIRCRHAARRAYPSSAGRG